MSYYRHAFTLIELSIVLIIIGLIVGGVLIGKDLIRAAELRSIISDWGKFDIALTTFKNKYGCIPGDCNKASQFGLGTNGNGSYYVDYPNVPVNNEHWLYWTHLANAELITGSYTGVAGPGGTWDAVVGVNVPSARISGVGYDIFNARPNSNWNLHLGTPGSPESHFIITGKAFAADTSTNEGAFTLLETVSLDQKMDDGIAATGKVRTHISYSNHNTLGCTNINIPPFFPPTFTYNINLNSGALCDLAYLFIP